MKWNIQSMKCSSRTVMNVQQSKYKIIVHQSIKCTPKYQMYTKVSNVHQSIKCTPKYQMYTKVSNVHQSIKCTPKHQMYLTTNMDINLSTKYRHQIKYQNIKYTFIKVQNE